MSTPAELREQPQLSFVECFRFVQAFRDISALLDDGKMVKPGQAASAIAFNDSTPGADDIRHHAALIYVAVSKGQNKEALQLAGKALQYTESLLNQVPSPPTHAPGRRM